MRRLLPVLLALAAGTAAPGAAFGGVPARDFELRAPAADGGGARVARAWRTATVRPGRRFDVVGFRWRGPAEPEIRLRIRRADGAWGRWVRVPAEADHAPEARERARAVRASAPVWAGGARALQYRLSRALPGLRLHFVTVGRRPALAQAAAAVPVRVAGSPPVVPRAAWGAEACPPRSAPASGSVRLALVHHTVTATEYRPEDAPAMVLGICRYHRNSNGWADIGYNFLVDRYGTIYEGRAGGIDRAIAGAQAQGFNSVSTGVASLGTFTAGGQTDAGLAALARIIGWKLAHHGQPTAGRVTVTSAGGAASRYPAGRAVAFDRVSGHRDAGLTSCPGDGLFAQLPALRRMVARAAPAPVSTPTTVARTAALVALSAPPVAEGGVAVVWGALAAGGAGAGGKPVVLEVRSPAGTWRGAGRAATGSDGSFAASVPLAGHAPLRARFAGDDALLPAASVPVEVLVRPLVFLSRGARRVVSGRSVRLYGRVRPTGARSLRLVVTPPAGGTPHVRTVPLSAGRFAVRLALQRPGLHRVVAALPESSEQLAATSPARHVRVLRRRR